jgi:hypothetical protein
MRRSDLKRFKLASYQADKLASRVLPETNAIFSYFYRLFATFS